MAHTKYITATVLAVFACTLRAASDDNKMLLEANKLIASPLLAQLTIDGVRPTDVLSRLVARVSCLLPLQGVAPHGRALRASPIRIEMPEEQATEGSSSSSSSSSSSVLAPVTVSAPTESASVSGSLTAMSPKSNPMVQARILLNDNKWP